MIISTHGTAQSSFAKIVKSGLVMWLDGMNKNSYSGSGTVWNDLSGNQSSGSLVNGPTFSNINGGVINFDGTDDNVSIGNTSLLRPSTELTISIWARADTIVAGYYSLLGQNPYTGAYLIYTQGGTGNIGGGHNPNGSFEQAITTTPISTTQFTDITFTFKMGDAIRSYINGTASVTTGLSAGTFSYNTSNSFLISAPGGGNAHFDGQVGSVKIYNRAISATEVQQNYNAERKRFGL